MLSVVREFGTGAAAQAFKKREKEAKQGQKRGILGQKRGKIGGLQLLIG